MPQPLRRIEVASADGSGNITFKFPVVPAGLIWSGNISIAGTTVAAEWTVSVGAASGGEEIGAFYGLSGFGPVQAVGSETIIVTGSRLSPGSQVRAIFSGYSARQDEDLPILLPTASGGTALGGGVGFITAVNVQDSPFLAKGDGITDDSAAVQQAINTIQTVGGVVFFPPGVYRVSGLIFYDNVQLLGAGTRATVLLAGNNGPVLQSYNFATLTGTNSQGGVANFALRQFTIDGNKASFPASIGLQVYGYGYIMDSVRVCNAGLDGFYSEWSSTAGSPGTDSMEAQIINCKFHDNDQNGAHFLGPHDTQWLNCISYENANVGFWVQPYGDSQFTNCHAWGNNQDYGYILDRTCVLVNCIGEGATAGQVWVRASNCVLDSLLLFAAGAGTPVGVKLGDAGFPVSGTLLSGRLAAFTSGAVVFINESASYIDVLVEQTGGTVLSGSPSASTILDLSVYSGATPPAITKRVQGGLQLGGSSGLYSGTGVPAVGLGSNGDFYFRNDGAAGSCVYQKRGGAWVATAA